LLTGLPDQDLRLWPGWPSGEWLMVGGGPGPGWGRGEGRDMDWRSRAVCGGAWAWLFFGPDGETPPERASREARAKAVCASCPVRAECLDFALAHHVRNGIWGGLNERERFRARLRRPGREVGHVSHGGRDSRRMQ
jgi:WhiB family redox-sensing transcriptional regulator